MKKKLDFGVFYTCYKEKESVEYSLNVLYQIYPEIPVYLVSDGGSDYTDFEEKWPTLKCTMAFDSRGFVPKIPDDNFREEYWQKLIHTSIFEFLERVKDSFEYTNKDYILVMEPDVLVRGELSIPENAKLLGSKVNPKIKKEEQLNNYLKNNGGIEIHGYGATPAIIERTSFFEVYDMVKNNNQIIYDLSLIDQTLANYDVLLPVLFALKGYEEEINDEIVECLRNPHWESSGKPLVHQFRVFYPKSNYDGRHKN